MERHRVVVLGGGFGGLATVRALRDADADITLIDRRNFHLFQPLLYQVATGSLSASEISSPLRAIFGSQKNVRVLLGDAQEVDPKLKVVHLDDGHAIPYDTLVLAVGSSTSYFGHDEWRPYAQSIKGIEDALAMRRKIYSAFEAAEWEGAAGPSPWLTFVIVGGGPTGVELAGALGEIARKTLKNDFRRIQPDHARIFLVDQAPRVLPTFSERLSGKAERALLRLGVRVRSGMTVTAVDENGVTMRRADGGTERVEAKTVLWAGGVSTPVIAQKLSESTGAPMEKGRFAVSVDLTIPGHPEIFVVGDLAAYPKPGGGWLPGVAQVALQEGRHAGRVIAQRLGGKPAPAAFHYADRGDMAVIGRASAVANIFGYELWGWPAWAVWALIHLAYLVEFQSRVIVLIRWAFQYFAFRRGARLITGTEF